DFPNEPESMPPVFAEDAELAGWSPVDLMFHTRTTLGRHDDPVGATYPLGLTGSPEPVVIPQRADTGIVLHRPRWEDLSATDPPLAVAMEGRRSTRLYGTDPVTAEELGDLLYRTARVRALLTPADSGDAVARLGKLDPRLSDRPYPGAGAGYELELYITVGRCAGIPPGIYHYDPVGHRLEPVSADQKLTGNLLGSAGQSAMLAEPPPVLITMTARFRRISWKYESLAYALVLEDVGALYQSLYLVCTAMRLAPCAVGSVHAAVTAAAFGTNWLLEPTVGQFIVGRAPDALPAPAWHEQPVNDPGWFDEARARLASYEPGAEEDYCAEDPDRESWRDRGADRPGVPGRWPGQRGGLLRARPGRAAYATGG
ncbi:MAG: SagB/ThcOx family dehydrogenase, partial [Streptosporangiaceae bacterium]